MRNILIAAVGVVAVVVIAFGVYFGTRSGRVYASRDEGRSWKLAADGLPPIVCVKAAVVAFSVWLCKGIWFTVSVTVSVPPFWESGTEGPAPLPE